MGSERDRPARRTRDARVLGTLIATERATAIGRAWAFASPLAFGAGALAATFRSSPTLAQLLFLIGGVVLVVIFVAIYRLQPVRHNAVLVTAALLGVAGTALWWRGADLSRVAPWWAGLLVVTIVGERLELSRTVGTTRAARAMFVAALALFVAGLAASLPDFDLGVRVAGAGLLALAAWLWRNDIARRTIFTSGLTRFMAACLLAGYAWLGIGGLLWLTFGGEVAGFRHDAMLHAVFVGFVISMVFGHAPVILPAVLGGSIDYRPWFYAPLVLLHASLQIRILGDLASEFDVVRWAGLVNAAAIVSFAVGTAASVSLARRPAFRERAAHV